MRPKTLLINYWKDLVLGSVETYFLEVGAYMSLKGAPAGVWGGLFLLNLTGNITLFLNLKMEEEDLKLLLFNYWNDLVLSSVETYFLKVVPHLSLKGAIAGAWEGCFFWIWLEVSQFLKDKNGGIWHKNFIV